MKEIYAFCASHEDDVVFIDAAYVEKLKPLCIPISDALRHCAS